MIHILLTALLLTSCTPSAFDLAQEEHAKLQEDPTIALTIPVCMTVHIVGHRALFSWELARNPASGICGYANWPQREVWVLGRRDALGRVVPNPALGHEVEHVLHWEDWGVADPDG